MMLCWMIVGWLSGLSPAAPGDGGHPSLVPVPTEVRWSESAPVELKDGAVAIVIGARASEPARCAADLLQRRVERRFGRRWPVLSEADDWKRHDVVLLLGERATNAWLDRLCAEKRLDLGETSPGRDGYVIDTLAADGKTIVLVGGSDARGTLYGQDTLYQLLTKRDGTLTLTPASVRDRPGVPWRGRPQTQVAHHLQPGIWDLYAISRVNFIDLRNGTYAFDAGYAFTDKDRAQIAEVIREARRRDIVVFGTVNSGVPRKDQGAVLDTFRQFIAMGVDGLWISFDDKGPGEAPEEIVAKVLELGRQHGIAGNRIATTPPKGSYQVIAAPFNGKVMKVAGMEEALWFWTPVPTPEELATARALGLKTKLSWWHNWPRPTSGFTHIEGNSTLGGGRRAYIELPSMAVGWHEPRYEDLARCGESLQAVMPWGGNAWEQYCVVPVINWWGWDAERHDWRATRARVYDTVFGPSAVAAAFAFDDTLAQVKRLFVYPARTSEWNPFVPPRLRRAADREKATAMFAKLDENLRSIERHAAQETMLDPERLQKALLDPMRAEVAVGRAAAELAYPEYWWDEHQRKILNAVHDGDLARADELAAAVRDRVTQEVGQVARALAVLRSAPEYAGWWQRRAALDGKGWKALVAERQTLLSKRIGEYGWFVVVIGKLLKDLPNVPLDWGRAKANAKLRVLATVLPEAREQFRGDWIGGPYREGVLQAAAFVLNRDGSCTAGDYAELPAKLPVSGPRDRLALLVYMNCHTKDAYGLEEVPRRWAGHTCAQVLWGDKVLWEGDAGLPRNGCEWDLVRLPPIPDTVTELPLRVRVVDKRDSDGTQAIVFVGPLRLVEIPPGQEPIP